MSLDAAELALAGGAALVAGAVNALAGGGTLVSFPALIAIGVPSLAANVTNTVSLCPGYLAGTFAQRDDLAPQMPTVIRLAGAGLTGGLAGSLLLEVTPERAFRAAVPWLIVISCVLLLSQDRTRRWVNARAAAHATRPDVAEEPVIGSRRHPSPLMVAAVFLAAVYGGFFGAGLGIMVLAILGLFSDEGLVRLNAVKQALSLVINVCAAVVFAATGHVRWQLVPIMATAALVGGHVGGRLTRVIDPTLLRRVVVVFGLAVATELWLT